LNYYEAQELLEAVKHGRPTSIAEINLALYLTGDLCTPLCNDGFDERMDRLRQSQSQGTGETRDRSVEGSGQDGRPENEGNPKC